MADFHEWQGPRGEHYRKPHNAECCERGPFCESQQGCQVRLIGTRRSWDHETGEPEPKPEVEQLLDDAERGECLGTNMDCGRPLPCPDHPAVEQGPMDESARAREVERIMRRRGGHWPDAARYADPNTLGRPVSTPRTDLVVQITLAGREPLEVTVPFQPDDRGPLVATSLVLRVAGMPILEVPFADHGAGLHTICSRTPGAEDDPAADQIAPVVTQ